MDTICTYCGEPSAVLDHLIPRCTLNNIPSRHRRHAGSEPGDRVSACLDCNSILGSFMFPSIEDRRAYVAGKLRRRLKDSPKWTEGELKELGPSLRAAVEAQLAADRRLIQRIAFAETV